MVNIDGRVIPSFHYALNSVGLGVDLSDGMKKKSCEDRTTMIFANRPAGSLRMRFCQMLEI